MGWGFHGSIALNCISESLLSYDTYKVRIVIRTERYATSCRSEFCSLQHSFVPCKSCQVISHYPAESLVKSYLIIQQKVMSSHTSLSGRKSCQVIPHYPAESHVKLHLIIQRKVMWSYISLSSGKSCQVIPHYPAESHVKLHLIIQRKVMWSYISLSSGKSCEVKLGFSKLLQLKDTNSLAEMRRTPNNWTYFRNL
jgi:hypothetical protein